MTRSAGLCAAGASPRRRLRPRGVYLLVGGGTPLGGMLAEILARPLRANLVLVGETIPPALAAACHCRFRIRSMRRPSTIRPAGSRYVECMTHAMAQKAGEIGRRRVRRIQLCHRRSDEEGAQRGDGSRGALRVGGGPIRLAIVV